MPPAAALKRNLGMCGAAHPRFRRFAEDLRLCGAAVEFLHVPKRCQHRLGHGYTRVPARGAAELGPGVRGGAAEGVQPSGLGQPLLGICKAAAAMRPYVSDAHQGDAGEAAHLPGAKHVQPRLGVCNHPLPRRRVDTDDCLLCSRACRGLWHTGALELHVGHGDVEPVIGGVAGPKRCGDGSAFARLLPPGPFQYHLGLWNSVAQAQRAPARHQLGGDAADRVVLAPGLVQRHVGSLRHRVPRHQGVDLHQRGGGTPAH
mmetsp:Transcript_94492/g.282107  ORF Transcript_94492/g.282107 Transcript_94492/m.282107 type:complete len:259 (+) Transcript_94492:398-1174(+)